MLKQNKRIYIKVNLLKNKIKMKNFLNHYILTKDLKRRDKVISNK